MNQHSPGVYFVQTDLHGVITSVNDLFACSIGLSAQKLLDTFFPFYLENGWFIFEGIDITSLVENGQTLEYDISIFFNGRIISTQWFVSALSQGSKGPVMQWMGVEKQPGAGMHDQKKAAVMHAAPPAQGEKERFLIMADTAPIMIWLSDENDRITYVNKYWIDFTGIRFAELSDNDWNILVHPADLPGLFEQLEKGSRDKTPLSMVYRLQYNTGEYRWVLANAVPRFLDNGDFAGYMGSVVDIHERKLAEEKIAFQANLIENVSDIIISTDIHFTVLTWNRTAEKIYGIPAAEAIGKSMPALLAYEYIDTNALDVLRGIKEKSGWKGDVIFRNSQDNLVYLQSTVSGLAGERDSLRGYVFVNRDITDKVKAEESIKISEAFYRSLIGNSLNGIALTDATGIINFAAPSVQNILGYEPEELVGTNIFTLVHPDDVPVARARFNSRLENDAEKEYIVIQIKQRNGNWLWCAVHAHNLLTHPYVQSMVIYFSDDTHRKGIERKLMESEIKFKSLFQSSLDIVNVLDDQYRVTFVTPSIKVVMGYDEDEVIGKSGLSFIHPDDAQRVRKALEELVNNPGQNVIIDTRIRNKNGDWVWMEGKGINKLSDPIINGIIVSFHDISDRKQSEQQLQGYSEHITNILSSITDGFIALDFNFNVLWWNPIAAQLTGIRDVDVLGKNLWEALPALKKTKALAEYRKAVANKTVVNFEIYLDTLKVYFDINAYPSQQGLFVYFKDITGRKTQEMLLTLEKEVLELNANPAASLKDTADYFLKGIESLNPGMTCSVQLLDEGDKRVRFLSGPSLHNDFVGLINNMKTGPRAGSCGTAMYFKKTIVVSDIITNPLWEDLKPMAEKYKLAACWSFPIVTAFNNMLGSFAAYYHQVQSPTDLQMELLSRAATLLGIIIENKQAEQKINISNERYLLATKATNDAIWDYDIRQGRLYWGEGFYTLFGYASDLPANIHGIWEAKIHPDDQERVVRLFNDAITYRDKGVVYAEYRFQKMDGRYAIVADRAFIVYDGDGGPVRLVGSMQDVTERKKLEMQVLKQEVDKQKIIAQAVVDAQEKERAEIGKDLHDNVNQILSTAKLYLELAKSDVNQREALIKRSADSIFNAINEIRSISKALVPPSVKDLGLIDSVKDLVESLNMTKALRVKFVHRGEFEKVISDKQKLMLFRIIQEQVNNVLKHAEAGKLHIELAMHEKQITLSVEDNGKGFELDKVKYKKGVGLSNIESRVSLFDGKVTITTAPGKGCKLYIQVPIHNY